MKAIEGGVCAAPGFKAGAIHAGVRKNQTKDDLAIIWSEVPCVAAGVFTQNQVKADCVKLTREHVKKGKIQAIIANSGNANAAAPKGMEHAVKEAQAVAACYGIEPEEVAVASTGVIGVELPVDVILNAIPKVKLLADNSEAAAKAIMTTDTTPKSATVEVEIDGHKVIVGGICKGSGMIHPKMGTMLAFITTDCAIDQQMLQKALIANTNVTFNRVSVDGDASTNDTCLVLANGLAGNPEITSEGEAYETFKAALKEVMQSLAIQIASDGEGASHLISVKVTGAATEEEAEIIGMSVVSSSLTKAAIFGADANWGRVLCAMGYSDARFDPEKVDIAFASYAGVLPVYEKGQAVPFSEERAKQILSQGAIDILINLHEGDASATCWGCDLTYDYVRINGDYRT